MVDRLHLDTDFLVFALAQDGPERARLREAAASEAVLEISAIAWYEFCCGPRTPDEVSAARQLFGEDGVVPFTRDLAERAGEQFRRLGSPRRRAADIAVGTTAVDQGALLLSRNTRDFSDIDSLRLEPAAPGRR